MSAKLFFEAMGQVDDRYYMEAASYRADRSRPAVRLLVRAAIAAALLAALTVTAWAVYRAAFQDYFLGPVPTSAPESVSPPSARLSMVGYQGTPEYNALKEWRDWMQAHPSEQYLAPDGGDDNADYAWPDYHPFYGAYYTEQGQALDAILDKYGLEPHHNAAAASAEDICDALGTGPLLPEGYSGSGYLYDDGTVNLQVYNKAARSGLYLFAAVKGTLTDISGFSSVDYEEWDHTVPSGETVDLVLDSHGKGFVLLETEGAYIYVELRHDFPGLSPIAKDELEALADGVNFAALADRFDGSAHPETAKAVAALREKTADPDRPAAPVDTPDPNGDRVMSASDETISDAVLEKLGRYGFGGLPEDFGGTLSGFESEQVYRGETFRYDSVSGRYSGETRTYRLEYARFSDRDLDGGEYLDLVRKTVLWSVSGSVTSGKVNGYDALLWDEGDGCSVYWYDESADLLFIASVSASPNGSGAVTVEEALAAAESVTEIS